MAPGEPNTGAVTASNDLPRYVDTGGMKEGTHGSHRSTDQDETSGDDAEGLIGISISTWQTYLKSAKTPAIEKARAIEQSKDYFTGAVSGNESIHGSPDGFTTKFTEPTTSSTITDTPSSLFDQQPSPWRAESVQEQRSIFGRVALAGALCKTRQRAHSGPVSVTEHLRKLIPDVSSIFSSKQFSGAGYGHGADSRDSSETIPVTRSPRKASLSKNKRTSSFSLPSRRLTDNGESTAEHKSESTVGLNLQHAPEDTQHRKFARNTSPPLNDSSRFLREPSPASARPLRRSTSENSLFLQRTTTGNFDDLTQFEDVSEMVNSRFKAITDSWQDASILPRMPKFDFSPFLPSILDKSSPDDVKKQAGPGDTRRPSSFAQTETTCQLPIDDAQPLPDPKPIIEHQRAHPILNEALSTTTGDLLLLGGYRGSVLRSAEPPHRQLWVPIKVGLNLRKSDLFVGLEREDELRMPETIFPSGILAHIGPIDIARRLLRHFWKCENHQNGTLRVHNYGYDWRLSPDLLAEQLIQKLEGLECNRPDTPLRERGAWVIAHSTGGLITRFCVNKRPELFAGVIYVGVPQACVNILGPLRNGDDVFMSSRVLTAQVNFTFRTSYALLPDDGRCFINKETSERYDVDFFDPESWEEYRLSPCIKPPLPVPPKPHRKSIAGALSDNLPAIPSRPAWLGGRPSTPDQTSTSEAAKDTLEGAASTIAHAADPGRTANETLEPASMAPTTTTTATSLFSSSGSTSIKTAVTIPPSLAKTYLTRTLSEIKQFRSLLPFQPQHENSNNYPPLAYMYAKSVPTVYGARVSSRDAIKHADAYDDLAFAAGDGVVLASMAQLPAGYRCVKGGRVESGRGHVGLLGDLEGIGRCLGAVVKAREKGVGLGREAV